jgi:peptide/nickel transport system permease protein
MNLGGYVLRRLLSLPPLLVGITLLTFVLTHATPADPVIANLGEIAASDPQVVAAFRHHWGIDRPLPEQYILYLWHFAHGDMGISIFTHQPVAVDLGQHLPATIELATAAMFVSILVGIPLGVLAASYRDTMLDQMGRVGALVGVSIPVFWLGLVAILVFYTRLGWAPSPGRLGSHVLPPPHVTGFISLDALFAGRFDIAIDALKHLVLPALVLSSYSWGVITRMMRGSMLDVLGEDYIRTARAKGVHTQILLMRHAMRNALIPTLTILGLSFGGLLSGAVVTESIFAWPGLGLYAFQSATSLDLPAIMGVGIVIATTYLFVNLLLDITYAVADPRIRVG